MKLVHICLRWVSLVSARARTLPLDKCLTLLARLHSLVCSPFQASLVMALEFQCNTHLWPSSLTFISDLHLCTDSRIFQYQEVMIRMNSWQICVLLCDHVPPTTDYPTIIKSDSTLLFIHINELKLIKHIRGVVLFGQESKQSVWRKFVWPATIKLTQK